MSLYKGLSILEFAPTDDGRAYVMEVPVGKWWIWVARVGPAFCRQFGMHGSGLMIEHGVTVDGIPLYDLLGNPIDDPSGAGDCHVAGAVSYDMWESVMFGTPIIDDSTEPRSPDTVSPVRRLSEVIDEMTEEIPRVSESEEKFV
ncbi:hypothetical protein, partial [Aquisalimonas sp.]|uniref:hypothetical protein n=1 Tax=Aquisalimonas sp. TaxID=1872621 RepID=UPI0025B7B4A2